MSVFNEEALRKLIKEEMLQVLESLPTQTNAPSEAQITHNIAMIGHEAILLKQGDYKPIQDILRKFAVPTKTSDDANVAEISKISLWKAAELGLTADEVINFLNLHTKSDLSKSLRNYISRTMSSYGALRIEGEDTYNVLVSVDEDVMKRVLDYSVVKNHIYKTLTPTKARITSGHRAALKQILLDKGYPVKDFGLIDESPPFKIQLRSAFTPYPHQLEAVEKFIALGNGVVDLPPGSGKTMIGVMATCKLQAWTLFITNRGNLCEQIKAEYLAHTDISSSNIATLHSGSKDEFHKPVTIVTYSMLTTSKKRYIKDIFKTKWGLIIFDECQHVPADVWRQSAEEIQAYRKLGLTATPVRENLKAEKEIFALIGPPIISIGWIPMAEEGYISEAITYEVLVAMSPASKKDYNTAHSEFQKIIAASVNSEKINIVEKLLEQHKDKQVIILSFYKENALKLSKKFGIQIVTGDTAMSKREPIYDSFRRGEIKQLILTSVGEDGVDLPNASVGINIDGLYGSRMGFSQRLGRILRPKDEVAIFYELVSEGTSEEDFSNQRRSYLVGQGYDFDTIDMTGVS